MASLIIKDESGSLTHTSALNGGKIVVVLQLGSGNGKTGKVDTLYYFDAAFLRGVKPARLLKEGLDLSVCGGCKNRAVASGGEGECYAHGTVIQKGGHAMHEKLMREGYTAISFEDACALIKGRREAAVKNAAKRVAQGKRKTPASKAYALRLGGFGDPSSVAKSFTAGLCGAALRWLGYFHQIATQGAAYSEFCMVSSDSFEETWDLFLRGLRTFAVQLVEEMQDFQVLCPSSKEFEILNGRTVPCVDCGLCNGTKDETKSPKDETKSPFLPPHGNAGKRMKVKLRAKMAERMAQGWRPTAKAVALANRIAEAAQAKGLKGFERV